MENREWRVAYTRKIIPRPFFAVPFWFDAHMPLSEAESVIWALWNINMVGWILLLITKPVRRLIAIVQTMYASSDRPEDKGLSQIYAWIQIPLSIVIIGGFSVVLRVMGAAEWTMIPILAVAIGDGLAEPVAVFWEDRKWFGELTSIVLAASSPAIGSSLDPSRFGNCFRRDARVGVDISQHHVRWTADILRVRPADSDNDTGDGGAAFLGQSVFTVLRLFDHLPARR